MAKKRNAKQAVKRPARFEDGLIFIPLTNGTDAFVDDTEDNRRIVLDRNWCHQNGYAVCKYGERHQYLHRLILPGVPLVDHANGNILDNRACNLRAATRAQNRMNSKPANGCSMKGAYRQKRGGETGKWLSYIQFDGKFCYLGTFDTEQAAHDAWLARARERDPDFVRGS